MTMWKWPTTKYVALEVDVDGRLGENKPLTPPLTNIE